METTNLKHKPTTFQDTIPNRLVRYVDLKPCKNAFVDTRTPGSDQKENFTIIGPGVSENPDQHVHVPLAHGFNIGGARQPGGCLNSQHSHETAEVFIVHSGRWRFMWGVDAKDGEVILNPGDTVSIPTYMFRGFENLGEKSDIAFLFAVLGRDDPGFVTWTPSVFELAKQYGLVLLANGRLIDTKAGESVPSDAILQEAPDEETLQKLQSPDNERLAQCYVKNEDLIANDDSPLASDGVSEAAVIGKEPSKDGFDKAPIVPWWEQGFHLRRMLIESGASTPQFSRDYEEVILMQRGTLEISLGDDKVIMGAGDTFSVPISRARQYRSISSGVAEFFVTLKGDAPGALTIL